MTSVRGPAFTLDEEERKALVRALAIFALRNPGWEHYCATLAEKLGGDRVAYEASKQIYRPWWRAWLSLDLDEGPVGWIVMLWAASVIVAVGCLPITLLVWGVWWLLR